ncbi:uncharacterized protein C6orf201 homolog [Tachyglossus aculeatus]|uniref:uncharacterized protein C6orf201 homolog n=1 Tax=Tachyglossus aculeatus TaxID=9261 RepID=UPI0018F2A43C|nr:uncharacterized protein C6orf201 homolog [Tachyglossus aculeatus]
MNNEGCVPQFLLSESSMTQWAELMAVDVRASLDLPPMAMCQKLKSYEQDKDIYRTFLELSTLHRLLPDPLRETLSTYICEEDAWSGFIYSSLENLYIRKELPSNILLTPPPSHVPRWERVLSNKKSKENREIKLEMEQIKETPMSTLLVRWLQRNMKPKQDHQTATRKLSQFGPLESITTLGQQTALVVFKEMVSACRAVSTFPADDPGTSFQCSWHHKFMNQYKVPRYYPRKSRYCQFKGC